MHLNGFIFKDFENCMEEWADAVNGWRLCASHNISRNFYYQEVLYEANTFVWFVLSPHISSWKSTENTPLHIYGMALNHHNMGLRMS